MWRSSWLLLACMVLPVYITKASLMQLNDADRAGQCADVAPGLPNIRLTAIPETTSIGAVWNAPANLACVDHYMVFVRPAGSTRQPTPHKVGSRSIIVSNLKPKSPYKVQVMAVNKRGMGPSSQATVTTLTGPHCNPRLRPGPPVSAKGLPLPGRTDRITASWKAPTSPMNACYMGYRILAYNARTGATVLNITVARTVKQLNINGLASGTPYSIQISTMSNVGDSATTAAVAVTTNSLVRASPPTGLQPTPRITTTTTTTTATTTRPSPDMAWQQALSPTAVLPKQPVSSSSSSIGQRSTTPTPAASQPRSRSSSSIRNPSVTSAPAAIQLTPPIPAVYLPAPVGSLNPALSTTLTVASPVAQFAASLTANYDTATWPASIQTPTPSSLALAQQAGSAISPSPSPDMSSLSSGGDIGPAPGDLGAAEAAGETASTMSSSTNDSVITSDCRADVEPQAPVSFTANVLSKSRIRLHWEHVAGGICVDGFRLDGYQLKTGDRVLGRKTAHTTFTLKKLTPGIEYAFTVAAVNQQGDSTPATAMAATPKD